MKQPLTQKQQQLLDFIEKYQMQHGKSPTVKEMRKAMRLKSDGFAVYCLQALAKKGAIQKDDTPRSVKLLPSVAERLHAEFVKIPVLGTVPAGGPMISEENVEDWVKFDSTAVKHPEDCFMLRVRGDSMEGAGFFEGDYVLANSKLRARTGNIVVALVDGGSTVKRFMTDGRGRAFLKPENPKYKNIYPEDELVVQGVVKGLMRWY